MRDFKIFRRLVGGNWYKFRCIDADWCRFLGAWWTPINWLDKGATNVELLDEEHY